MKLVPLNFRFRLVEELFYSARLFPRSGTKTLLVAESADDGAISEAIATHTGFKEISFALSRSATSERKGYS